MDYDGLAKHLTKLKKLPKYAYWNIPYSWCLQDALKQLKFGYDRFFKGLVRRLPRFKRRMNYKSQTFDGSQVKVEVLDRSDGCPVAKVRIR